MGYHDMIVKKIFSMKGENLYAHDNGKSIEYFFVSSIDRFREFVLRGLWVERKPDPRQQLLLEQIGESGFTTFETNYKNVMELIPREFRNMIELGPNDIISVS